MYNKTLYLLYYFVLVKCKQQTHYPCEEAEQNSLDDAALVRKLVAQQIPLTVCPISNIRLNVITDMKEHPLRKMLDSGLLVSINSDDPAYFGGYLVDNYLAVTEALGLSREELCGLAVNSFATSFLDEHAKITHIAEANEFFAGR